MRDKYNAALYERAQTAIDVAIAQTERLPRADCPISAVAMHPVALAMLEGAKQAVAVAASQMEVYGP